MPIATAQPEGPPTTLRALAAVALAALALALAACGGDDEAGARDDGGGGTGAAVPDRIERRPENAAVEITVGSKNFTEQQVLGEIYAAGLRAAGYTVRTRLNLGDERAALRAVRPGRVDAYPEYTGTALLSLFGVAPSGVPSDPGAAFEQVRAAFERQGLVAFPPTPFTSANEVAVTQATAERRGLQKISDLEGQAGELTLAGPPECRQRLDCLRGLEQVYGLRFKRFLPVPIAKRHAVLASGRADVSVVFTTDPQIRRERFVLLEDDRGMMPPYNSTLVVRKGVADEAGPDLARTISTLQQDLTDEAMQELNARVDLDDEDPATVASEYLRESRLVR
jgi:osmoprotectant transport system substrate-binding protein